MNNYAATCKNLQFFFNSEAVTRTYSSLPEVINWTFKIARADNLPIISFTFLKN